jgi:hypothetical protein
MIGSPRTKGQSELEWSAIKRAIQARVNYEAQVWRERELNDKLDAAWQEFKDRLKDDELPEYDPAALDALGPGR